MCDFHPSASTANDGAFQVTISYKVWYNVVSDILYRGGMRIVGNATDSMRCPRPCSFDGRVR